MDVRSSLTGRLLMAAAMQARAAAQMESKPVTSVTEDDKVAHFGYVVGAIMQTTAALQGEIWEVMVYGPGYHLGSGRLDRKARDLLAPLADTIDRASVLDRYQLVLHILEKKRLERGALVWQDARLVVALRNELAHYKSRWGEELGRSEMLKALAKKRHPKPPFILGSANFFPYECLSAACADWGVRACFAFLDAFYTNLGFPGRLDGYRT